MAAFNAEKHIRPAIDSILSQTFKNFELIVVNDGSEDSTLEILQSVADDRVWIMSNSGNEGLAKSLNTAIRRARSRYIARQDADDISLPRRLQKQFDYLQKHPGIAVLGTARKIMSDNGNIKTPTPPLELPTFNDLLRSNCFVHGSVMIRKEALDKIGFYNEMFRYSQDYDLWLRLTKEFSTANLKEPLYVIRRHADRATLKNLRPAILYRLLARNLAQEKVEDSVLQQIRAEGIETYYNSLLKEDKIFYHNRARKKYMKYFCNQQALEQCQKLMKLQGLDIGVICDFLTLKLRLLSKKKHAFFRND